MSSNESLRHSEVHFADILCFQGQLDGTEDNLRACQTPCRGSAALEFGEFRIRGLGELIDRSRLHCDPFRIVPWQHRDGQVSNRRDRCRCARYDQFGVERCSHGSLRQSAYDFGILHKDAQHAN